MSNNNSYCQIEASTSTTYHPFGMLDRDQRTTKMLPKNYKYYSNSKLQKTIFNNSQNVILMHNTYYNNNNNNSQNSDNIKCCFNDLSNYQNVKINQINGERQNKSVLLNSNCSINKITNQTKNNRCQLSTSNDDSCNLISYKNPVKYYKSKSFNYGKMTKLSNLLICICFWLLILQKTRAMPIIGCKKYVEGFEPVYLQANMAYSGHLEPLSKYAIKYHRRSHEALHQLWQNETIESLKPLQFHDYMKGTDLVTNLSKDNLESDKIVAEFQDIYARIMVLHKAFENITNESNAVDNFDDSYFRDFITMSGYLKSEIIRALEVLNIAKPDYNSPNLKDGHTKELRDWIVIREHMKLLKYIQEVNRILEMNCSNGD